MATRRTRPPAPTTIFLVRHGQTPSTGKVLPGRAPGLELAELGRAQAEAAAARLAELPTRPTAVYASPLERTRQTAQPIARALGLRVRQDAGLLECDFGEWTGRRLDALRKRPEWSQVQRAPSLFRFPGGESFAEMATRGWEAVVSLAERHRGESIVAVSHADPIKAILAQATGAPLDQFQRLVVSPCSISTIVLASSGVVVLNMNTTGSLKEIALS
jgi:probable phosphoglycerate mutase